MQSRELVIQIRLPRLSARNWVTLVAALLLIGGGIAYANVMWTPFAQGEKLSSAKMNANLQAMADAINVLQNKPPGTTPLPHLILDQGKVDLGIFLGLVPTGQNPPGWPIVFSSTLQAPHVLASLGFVSTVFYDGMNCTGTAYGTSPTGLSNGAFNTTTGTIYQTTGPPVSFTGRSYFSGGNCTNSSSMPTMPPLKDTKVPNIYANNGLLGFSIQMM